MRVHAQRVDLPFAQLPVALVATLINAALLSYVLWSTIDHRYILVWLAAICAVVIGRVILLRAYRHRVPAASPRTWGMLFCIGAAANGVVWGASAVALYPSANITLQVFLVFVVGGMTAGATASTAAFFPAFIAFAAPALVPTVLRVIGADRVHLAMGAMLALFGVAMTRIARANGRRLVDSIRLRFKNEALVQELEAASNHLAALNRDLETRVAERTSDLIEANRAKDEFLATVSHELRTPLTAIIGWAQLMKMGELSASQRQHAVETIERNALAQSKLVEDLLDLSRIQSSNPKMELAAMQPAAVVDAAVDAIRPVMDASGIQFEVHVDRTAAGATVGDAARIQQIIGNLLSNAAKFTPRGGRVTLDLKYTDQWIEILVSDTGEGMSADFIPFAFDRFRQAESANTRARGGLGLGLAISRQLAELHGGTLEAHSEGRGRGSTFTLRVPRTPVAPPPREHIDASRVHVDS